MYKALMSYLTYRLDETTQRRLWRDTENVRKFLNRMALTVKYHRFPVEYPIRALHLLSRYVR